MFVHGYVYWNVYLWSATIPSLHDYGHLGVCTEFIRKRMSQQHFTLVSLVVMVIDQ